MKRIAVILLSISLFLCTCACGQKPSTWQEQYDLGVRYLSEGNYEEAIIAFLAAIEIDSKQPNAYLKAAEAYEAMGNAEDARVILELGLQATEDERFSALLTIEETPVNEDDFEVIPKRVDGSIDHGILQVQVKDSRSASVTIHGLTMQDTYMANLPTSEENTEEYRWMIEMYMPNGAAYSVSTAWWAYGEEKNVELPLAQMQHSVWAYDGDSWPLIGDAEMRYTADSISWDFTIPEEYPFDFAQVERYVVDVCNVARDEYVRTTYLVE